MAFSTKIKGNHHLQGNVQVYNVRIEKTRAVQRNYTPNPCSISHLRTLLLCRQELLRQCAQAENERYDGNTIVKVEGLALNQFSWGIPSMVCEYEAQRINPCQNRAFVESSWVRLPLSMSDQWWRSEKLIKSHSHGHSAGRWQVREQSPYRLFWCGCQLVWFFT